MAGPVAGIELIGELRAGGAAGPKGRAELSILRLGHPRATAVSAAAGRLAHAADDIHMRGLSACASGRAVPSLHPYTPASKGRIRRMVEGGATHPQARGGGAMFQPDRGPVLVGARSLGGVGRQRLRERGPDLAGKHSSALVRGAGSTGKGVGVFNK